jgi:hypothetical protein
MAIKVSRVCRDRCIGQTIQGGRYTRAGFPRCSRRQWEVPLSGWTRAGSPRNPNRAS